MYKLILFFGICSAFALGSKLRAPAEKNEEIIGCYYNNLEDTMMDKILKIQDVDGSLCTYLYYGPIGINPDASVQTAEMKTNQFKTFNGLKKNRHLKTLVSMGYAYEKFENYTDKVMTDPTLREKLVNNIVDFVQKYELNGIELDLLYPGQANPYQIKVPSNTQNFVSLLKALSQKFDKKGLILSLVVDASDATAEIYDIKGISKYVNFVNLKAYNFQKYANTGIVDGKFIHNSPMYPSSKENAEERKMNIDYIVKHWISHGVPPSNIMLGIAFYGKAYTLANPKQIGRGAKIYGVGMLSSGAPSYYEVCSLAKNPEWKHLYDEQQQVSCILKGDQIISSDDVESIKKKARYVKRMNLGGVLVDGIGQDDFDGHCGGGKFPLLKTLNRVLKD